MATTYTKIASVTVGSGGASSIDFTSIPSTYTDLVVKLSARDNRSGESVTDVLVKVNNSSSNLSDRRVYGNGSGAFSDNNTTGRVGVEPAPNSTSSTFGNFEIYFPNYSGSTNKSYSSDAVSENNATLSFATLTAGLWSQTTAINQLTFYPAAAASFVQYSTATLYGVTNASTAATKKATGGDIIVTSGGYTYHAFLTSGTFTPSQALTCDYLVIAGGGGGGKLDFRGGGGGGAGGLRSTVQATGGGGSLESALSLSSGVGYTVTIGAGGAGGKAVGGEAAATSGSNSVFSTITSTGGGFGCDQNTNAASGGSGGGGGGAGGSTAAGTGTTNQGRAGGAGYASFAAGGGGGANTAGVAAVNTVAGAGGAGVNLSTWAGATSTGVSNVYAGGGGGNFSNYEFSGTSGAGGAGGGGAGAVTTGVGTSGTANTGGGGGGSDRNDAGRGGSGIVIVRYAV
jgi:hypothetical protein